MSPRLVTRRPSLWTVAAVVVAVVVASPVLVVLSNVFADSDGVWRHLADTVLAGYLENTAWLLLGVGLGTATLGLATAWIVTMWDFPGRRIFSWALLLPLAMPTYLMAYTWTDVLQYSGPLQTALRDAFGWERDDYWFPPVRSLGGAIVTFTLVLYPYVYLLARAAFLQQGAAALEASRMLGAGPWRTFRSVAIPLARPAVVAGVGLALMETLAEFGAVDYFAVDTFTTGIYRTWTARGAPVAASQLAAVMVMFVFVLLILERRLRGDARFDSTTSATSMTGAAIVPRRSGRGRSLLAFVVCATPVTVGFIAPVMILIGFATDTDKPAAMEFEHLLDPARNSFLVAVGAAFLITGIGVLMAYAQRLDHRPIVRLGARIVSLGYAVPGSVVAVGILGAVAFLAKLGFGNLTGTVGVLLLAYAVRFSSVSVQTLEAGLQKIAPSLDHAARSLGASPGRVLRRVHVPLLRPSLLTAMLIVFVDVMKELPATMIVRPFDFDTLAVKVHSYASDERLAQSALPALLIVAVGLGPVILLGRNVGGRRERSAS